MKGARHETNTHANRKHAAVVVCRRQSQHPIPGGHHNKSTRLLVGFLAYGSSYSPHLLSVGLLTQKANQHTPPMAKSGFRPRLQRRVRGGFSPPSLESAQRGSEQSHDSLAKEADSSSACIPKLYHHRLWRVKRNPKWLTRSHFLYSGKAASIGFPSPLSRGLQPARSWDTIATQSLAQAILPKLAVKRSLTDSQRTSRFFTIAAEHSQRVHNVYSFYISHTHAR